MSRKFLQSNFPLQKPRRYFSLEKLLLRNRGRISAWELRKSFLLKNFSSETEEGFFTEKNYYKLAKDLDN